MKRRLLSALAVALVALSAVSPAVADDPDEAQMREIARRLQCPVCQNLSVLDSPSQLAGQMRELILQKLKEGESPEAIQQYFVERYGEGVLLDPPKRGFTLGLWAGAAAIAAAGLGGLALVLRARLRAGRRAFSRPVPAVAMDDEDMEWLQDELAVRSPVGSARLSEEQNDGAIEKGAAPPARTPT